MSNIASFALVGALLALGLPVAPAQAQLARTFVSANGDDLTDCSRTTPCRTFQAAHDKTFANGEITVLDPGGYGAVTITKTISIINDGVGEAGVLVSGGGTGITINTGASDAVSLRGLTIKGIGFGGGNGIQFNSGQSLTVENCVIRNLTGSSGLGDGFRFWPSASSTLAVSNTLVADNAGFGIAIHSFGLGTVRATFDRVEAYNNSIGIFVDSSLSSSTTINATVANSVVAGNGATGILASSSTSASTVMVVGSVIAHNNFGLVASGATATLRVGQSAVTGNAISWQADSGGTLRSYGNNNIDGNADSNPAPTVIAKK